MNELSGAQPGFVVMKSYDGGRNWEQARQCGDFVTAADLAQALRSEHPAVRTRVDVRASSGRIRVRKDR